MPVRVIVTQGTDADCQQAVPLIAEMTADYLLADRGYDADYIVEQAKRQGMEPVIPSRKNRKEQRDYDRHLYKIRHLVENAFLHLKQWGGIATRYAKRTSSFLATLHIQFAIASNPREWQEFQGIWCAQWKSVPA